MPWFLYDRGFRHESVKIIPDNNLTVFKKRLGGFYFIEKNFKKALSNAD